MTARVLDKTQALAEEEEQVGVGRTENIEDRLPLSLPSFFLSFPLPLLLPPSSFVPPHFLSSSFLLHPSSLFLLLPSSLFLPTPSSFLPTSFFLLPPSSFLLPSLFLHLSSLFLCPFLLLPSFLFHTFSRSFDLTAGPQQSWSGSFQDYEAEEDRAKKRDKPTTTAGDLKAHIHALPPIMERASTEWKAPAASLTPVHCWTICPQRRA